MRKFSSPTQKTGELGEDLSVRLLLSKGHVLVERNYTKKWGEIDIVTKKKGVIHFIEVKSISANVEKHVSHGTLGIRPEDHMDRNKQERLKRVIETYIHERKVEEWRFDLVCVFIDQNSKKAFIDLVENIIL